MIKWPGKNSWRMLNVRSWEQNNPSRESESENGPNKVRDYACDVHCYLSVYADVMAYIVPGTKQMINI